VHPLHPDKGQLDRYGQWSSLHVSAPRDFARSDLSSAAIEFFRVLPVREEVHPGLLETLDGYRRFGHFSGLKFCFWPVSQVPISSYRLTALHWLVVLISLFGLSFWISAEF
jgi:hypothetical protein